MDTTSLASAKNMNGKTIGIAAGAAIIVLAIVGWTAGWFGGAEPATPATPAVTTEQPAATSGSTTAPAAPSGQ